MALTFENFFLCPGNLGEGTDEFAKVTIRFNNLLEQCVANVLLMCC
jgi:hypothetical protein